MVLSKLPAAPGRTGSEKAVRIGQKPEGDDATIVCEGKVSPGALAGNEDSRILVELRAEYATNGHTA